MGIGFRSGLVSTLIAASAAGCGPTSKSDTPNLPDKAVATVTRPVETIEAAPLDALSRPVKTDIDLIKEAKISESDREWLLKQYELVRRERESQFKAAKEVDAKPIDIYLATESIIATLEKANQQINQLVENQLLIPGEVEAFKIKLGLRTTSYLTSTPQNEIVYDLGKFDSKLLARISRAAPDEARQLIDDVLNPPPVDGKVALDQLQ